MSSRLHGLIDSHAHLSKPELAESLDSMLGRALQIPIQAIINICTDEPSLIWGLEISKKYPWIFNTAAVPPHDVLSIGESLFPLIAEHARKGNFVGIGETGLDYHYYADTKELQKHFLRKYFHLALECNLPVVIHCRDAFADFFDVLDSEYTLNGKHAPGVLHCFTGTLSESEEVIKRGWYLSLSGIVTFKKSEELREVAKRVPLSQLLIETDSPYLAPQSKRGKTNEPAFIEETAALIASLRGISLEELIKATSQNAQKLFRL